MFLREEAVQPGRGLKSTFMPDVLKAPKLKGSDTEDLFLQDDPNFNIFTETRDLMPSYSRPIGTVGLGLPGPQVLWLSQLPFFPTEHQTLM